MEPYRDLGTFQGLSGFSGAVGKLVRAKYQLRDLDHRFKSLAESNPYRTRKELKFRSDEKIADYLFIVDSLSLPKREWGVLIGEVVDNLRSALDHATYAAAARPTGQTQFPIFTRECDWDDKHGPMIETVPEPVAELIEQVQPYHAPKGVDPRANILSVLNRLSNYDKHRLLHTAVIRLKVRRPGSGPSANSAPPAK